MERSHVYAIGLHGIGTMILLFIVWMSGTVL
jgi:hypothetical protein